MKFKKKIYFISLIIFLLVLVLNALSLYTSDDFAYMINNGIVDIFKQEYIQYFTWNGRSVAHIIDRLLLTMPKIIFNILNSCVFVYMINLLYKHATDEKDNPALFSLIALAVFIFVPFFGQTVLWQTGSCNYLWMTTIVLQFLLFYRKNIKINPILLMLLGVLAGWSNENTGGACIMIAILMTIYDYIKTKKINISKVMGLLGAMIGFVVLVIAPGNAIRAQEFVNNNPLVYTVAHDLTSTIKVLLEGLLPLFVVYIFMFITLFKHNKEKVLISSIYMLAAIADVCAIILSPVPVLWDRSMFFAAISAIISVAIMFDTLNYKHEINIYVRNLCISILLVLSVFSYTYACVDLGYIRYQNHQRANYIEQQKLNDNLDPIVFRYDTEFLTKYNPQYGLNDIEPYYNFWLNEAYAKYMDINSIQSTSKIKWELVYKNGDTDLMRVWDMKEYLTKVINDDNYIVFISCSTADDRYKDYKDVLNEVGVPVEDNKNFAYVISGKEILNGNANNEGLEIYGAFDNKEYYVASYNDGTMSDIVIDGVEYNNDQTGINVVVFNKTEYRVTDSLTFVLDYGMSGIRHDNTR